MSDRPIPPVDPIVATQRTIQVTRGADDDLMPIVPDAATQHLWQQALGRELTKAKGEAVRRDGAQGLRRWRELVVALWPRRRRDEDDR